MSLLILPSRFTSQPRYTAQIDRSSQLSEGLISAFNFGTSLRDVVSGGFATLYSNARIESRAGVVGVGNFGDSVSCLYLPNLSAKLGTKFTVAWVTAGANSSDQGFGNLSTDGSTEHSGYGGTYYLSGATPNRLSFSMPSGMRPYDQNTLLIASNVGVEWRAYQNRYGKIGGSTIYAANNGWPSDANLGGQGSFQYTGIFAGFFAWSRQLSDAESIKFVDNPWQIFKAKPRPLFFSADGSIGPSSLLEALTFTETYGAIVSYLAGLSESTSSVDSQNAVRASAADQAEAASLIETTTSLIVVPAGLSEATSTVDTPGASRLTPAAQSETTSSSDTVASSMTAVSSQAETFTSVDSQSSILSTLGTIAETITSAAAQDGSVSGSLLGSISETVTASDTVAANIQTLAAIVEAISALETLTSNVATTSAISEILSAVDSSSTGAILSGGVAETLSVVDSLAAIKILLADTAELLSTADSQNANVSGSVQAIVEAVTVIDEAFAVLFTSAEVQETAVFVDLQYGYVNATSALTRLVFLLPKETRQLIVEKLDNG